MSHSGWTAAVSGARGDQETGEFPPIQSMTVDKKEWGWWPYLLLIGLVLLVYANGLGNAFSSNDDYRKIVDNPNLRSLRGIAGYFTRSVRQISPHPLDQTMYRPLTWLRRALERALWGPRPFGYRLTHILLHALSACLVYRLLLGAFGKAGPALAVALIWALHPAHTEAVTWISGGSGPTIGFPFALLALICLLRATATPERWPVGSPLLYLLALLSYELVVPLPALALLLDAAIARQPGDPVGARLRRHWRLHLPLWTVLAGYLLLRGVFLGFGTSLTSLPGLTEDLGPRLLRMPQILATYLGVFLVPLRLTIDREVMLVPVHSVWEPAVLLPALLLFSLGAITWWLARRSPLAFFGGFWFCLAILPASNLVPQWNRIAEHFLYFPAIGLASVGVAGAMFMTDRLSRAFPTLPVRRYAVGLLLLLLIGYGARTMARNRDWADDTALFRATVAANPNSLGFRVQLGLLYARQGQLAAAEQELTRALQLEPASRSLQLQLATVWARQGKVAEAEAAYRALLARDPTYVTTYLHLGLLAQRQGHPEAAIAWFQQALARKPEHAESRTALGLAYLRQGRVEAAIAEFQRVLQHAPQDTSARSNLAAAYLRQGRVEAAIAELERAVALDPGNAALQHNLGLAYERAGRPDLAARAFRRSAGAAREASQSSSGQGLEPIGDGSSGSPNP